MIKSKALIEHNEEILREIQNNDRNLRKNSHKPTSKVWPQFHM